MRIGNQQKFMVPGVRSTVKQCILPEKIVNEIIQHGNMNLRRQKYHYLHMTLQILSHKTSFIAVQFVVCKVLSSICKKFSAEWKVNFPAALCSGFACLVLLLLRLSFVCCICKQHTTSVQFLQVLNFFYMISKFHIFSLLIVGI